MSLKQNSLRTAELKNKKVLLRVDFNVPFDKKGGVILDGTRITKVLPTIEFIASQGGRIFLLSHLGRPKRPADKKEYSFKRLVPQIQELLPDLPVTFLSDLFDVKKINSVKSGEIGMLENIRFFDEESSEEENIRRKFAKKISTGFDLYVNDAFSACHRDHVSVTGVPQFLPGYAGFLLEEEIQQLTLLEENIKRPYVAIVGGAKVSTKFMALKGLIKKVDTILLGGAMAYTFLRARAIEIGDSLFEKEYLAPAFQIIDEAVYHKKQVLLPVDHVVAPEINSQAKTKNVKQNIPNGFIGGDIGSQTIKKYSKIIRSAKTIFWNGPMGVFELPQFMKGTISIAREVAKANAVTVVGGGDSIRALGVAGVTDQITHVSGGGGASLEFLEGRGLPGIAALAKHE